MENASPLLNLPGELRELIWKYSASSPLSRHLKVSSSGITGLLSCCKQIQTEAAPYCVPKDGRVELLRIRIAVDCTRPRITFEISWEDESGVYRNHWTRLPASERGDPVTCLVRFAREITVILTPRNCGSCDGSACFLQAYMDLRTTVPILRQVGGTDKLTLVFADTHRGESHSTTWDWGAKLPPSIIRNRSRSAYYYEYMLYHVALLLAGMKCQFHIRFTTDTWPFQRTYHAKHMTWDELAAMSSGAVVSGRNGCVPLIFLLQRMAMAPLDSWQRQLERGEEFRDLGHRVRVLDRLLEQSSNSALRKKLAENHTEKADDRGMSAMAGAEKGRFS